MTDTIDRAQLAALGARPACPLCGTPSTARGHGYTSAGYTCPPPDVVAALRDELARVTAERDALRGAMGDLFTARSAYEAELSGREAPETVQAKIARAAGALDEAWERALETLARTGGV